MKMRKCQNAKSTWAFEKMKSCEKIREMSWRVVKDGKMDISERDWFTDDRICNVVYLAVYPMSFKFAVLCDLISVHILDYWRVTLIHVCWKIISFLVLIVGKLMFGSSFTLWSDTVLAYWNRVRSCEVE